MKDDLGDRMKGLESAEAGRKLDTTLPIMVRLDGKGFSKWTYGLERPFDERMSQLMRTVTDFLVKESHAQFGYTQSDEITLCLYSDSPERQIFFDGKVQKLNSVLSSFATAKFNSLVNTYFMEDIGRKPLAFFDCRVWNVPSLEEATNCVIWRQLDASKNSVSMAARHYYSHKELMNKTCEEMKEMLLDCGVSWNDYPNFFKIGTLFLRRKKMTKFSYDELEKLPEKHEARVNPDFEIERSIVEGKSVNMLDIEGNERVEFLFGR